MLIYKNGAVELRNYNPKDKKYKRKFIIQRIFMPLSDLEDYYLEQRKYQFEQGKRIKYIHLRKLVTPLFVKALSVDRFFENRQLLC